jgi:hypothetical protein
MYGLVADEMRPGTRSARDRVAPDMPTAKLSHVDLVVSSIDRSLRF